MVPGRGAPGRCFHRKFRFDWLGIFCVGKLPDQLFQARFGRIETTDLLDRFPGIVQHTGFDSDRRAQQTAFDPPPPHPQLEALPLLRGSVGLQHGARECKLRAQQALSSGWRGSASDTRAPPR